MTRKSTITKELAIIERKLSETTNQVLKDALKKKQERLKSELKDASKTAPQLAQNLLSQKAKVKSLSKIDFNDLVRRLAKKPEYAFLKTMSKSTVRTDLERKAKPVGWRFKGRGNYDKPTMTQVAKGKKSGSVYREARAIRSDVNLNVRLENGGSVKKTIKWNGKDYQSEGPWTVFAMSKDNIGLTISVNNWAMWSTDPHDIRNETFRLLENGKLKGQVIFKSGKIQDYADRMYKLSTETSLGETEGLTAKDYADIIRVWIDMQQVSNKKEHGGTIGDSGTITDTRSMYQGKMGFIEMDMGNEWIVKVLDNGKEKSVTVRKSGFKVVHDDQMSQGGVVINGISINVGDKGTYGRSKEQITITGITPKIINFTTSEGKKKGIYRDAFAKSYVPNGSKTQSQSSKESNPQKTSSGRITMDDKMKLSAYKKLELRKKELKLSKDRYKYEKEVLDRLIGNDYAFKVLSMYKEMGGSNLIANIYMGTIEITCVGCSDSFLQTQFDVIEKYGYAPKNKFVRISISTARSVIDNSDPKTRYNIDDFIKLASYKKDTMEHGGKIKEGDTWEWHTTEYDPARGNNYKFVKKVTIVEIDNKGQVIAQEVGSSRKFIIRQPEKYLKKKI